MLYDSDLPSDRPSKDGNNGNEEDIMNSNNNSKYVSENDVNDKKNIVSDSKDGLSSYTFNGKVVAGIGIIMIISVTITISIGMMSQSQSIHLTLKSLVPSFISSYFFSSPTQNQMSVTASSGLTTSSLNSAQDTHKQIVLIQQDFGWNGTSEGPSIVVDKGDKVQIVIINRGFMAHNFGIASIPQDIQTILDKEKNMSLEQRLSDISYNIMSPIPCPGCKPYFEEGHINIYMKPGTQQITNFVADKAGEFKYFCMVRGHIWLGMLGDFIVRDNGGEFINNKSES